MTWRFTGILIACLGATPAAPCASQQSADENLRTCLTGKYPALCDHQRLTSTQLQQVHTAEREENYRVCSTGRYPALCKYSWLNTEQRGQVATAERNENLRTCLIGRYPALCHHEKLSSDEAAQVLKAEKQENLQVCLAGRYPALCRHALLNPDEMAQATSAEVAARRQAAQSATRPRPSARRGGDSGCDDGHWIESVSNDGSIVKLEDGSIWEVDAADAVDAMLWLPVTEIIECGDRLINVDDNETVNVTQLK